MDIKETTIEKIYEDFFEWWAEKNQDPNYHTVLEEHVILTRHLKLENSSLLNALKSLRFIKIGKEFYPANECYTPLDPILKFAYPDRLLPESYQTKEWQEHLKLLGLNMKATSFDLIRVAEVLSETVWQISDESNREICEKLLNRINNYSSDINFLNRVVRIKFLPSEFSISESNDETNNLLLKIYRPPIDRLICIEESIPAIHKHLAWLEQPILPEFCNVLDEDLCKNLDLLTIKNNFENMVKLLEAPDYDDENYSNILNNLKQAEMEELRKILSDYYKTFRILMENDEDNKFQLVCLSLVLIESTTERRRFVQPDLVVKNLSRCNQIEDYFYQAPVAFEAYWSLFESLGSIQNLGIDQCREILKSYYEELKDNKIMSDSMYKNSLIVFKILFADGIILKSPAPNEDLVLYAPNLRRQMRPFHELFYSDKAYQEGLLENNKNFQEICLFDVSDLIDTIKNSKNFSFIVDIDNLSWNKILRLYNHPKPRPLSNILTEQVRELSQAVFDEQFTNKYLKL